MHLVGFIIRIYHDVWPSECQTDNEIYVIISNQANSGVIFNQLKHSGCYMNYHLNMSKIRRRMGR